MVPFEQSVDYKQATTCHLNLIRL